jgi:anti-sigma factor RsiW
MTCREAEVLLHARLDNELDIANCTSIDHHLAECRACAAQYESLQNLHEEISTAELTYAPSPKLEQKLASRFLLEKKSSARFWDGSWLKAYVTATAAAGVIILILLTPNLRRTRETDATSAEILDNHLRSLQPGHLVDVPSSDQHTVKPWFQGKVSFAPLVPELTNNGFILIGGRLEVIHQQPAAAIVYRRRQHLISLYVTPSPGADANLEVSDVGGYHVAHWTRDKMSYWAVSDVGMADLRQFADLVRGT